MFDRILASDDEVIDVEYRFRHGGEEWRLVRPTGRNLLEDPAVGAVVVNTQDFTAVKERERELATRDRMLDVQADGVYALDADGYITSVNSRMAELTGYEEADLIGRHVSDLVEAGDLAVGGSPVRCLRSDTGPDVATVAEPMCRADGSTFPAETRITLLPSDDGFRGSVGSVRDISDRQRRERLLEGQNERLEVFASAVSHDLRSAQPHHRQRRLGPRGAGW